jgi:hypothetical protein
MGAAQLKELKRLQKENERLRRAVSDLTLDKLILGEGYPHALALTASGRVYRTAVRDAIIHRTDH